MTRPQPALAPPNKKHDTAPPGRPAKKNMTWPLGVELEKFWFCLAKTFLSRKKTWKHRLPVKPGKLKEVKLEEEKKPLLLKRKIKRVIPLR